VPRTEGPKALAPSIKKWNGPIGWQSEATAVLGSSALRSSAAEVL